MNKSLKDIRPILAALLMFGAILMYVIIGRSVTWLNPPLSDGMLFAYIGKAWLAGDVLYLRIWDLKPPGIFAINAVAFALFQDGFFGLAIFEGAFLLGTSLTVYALLRQWQVSQLGSWFGSLVFAITTSHDNFHLTAEVYMLWPAALSIYFFCRALPSLSSRWFYVSGLCVGAATVFKLTGLAFYLAQCVFLFVLSIASKKLSFTHFLKSVTATFSGILTFWIPILLYFGYHGAIQEAINASFIYPFYYSASIPRSFNRSFGHIREYLYHLRILFIFILIGVTNYLLITARLYTRSRLAINSHDFRWIWYFLALWWLLIDIVTAVAGNRTHVHYFYVVTLSTAVASGITYSVFVQDIEKNPRDRVVAWAIVTILVASLAFDHFQAEVYEKVHRARYGHSLTDDREFGHDAGNTQQQQIQGIRTFFDSLRNRNDTLFTVEYKPYLPYSLQMKSPVNVLDLGFRKLFSGNLKDKFGKDVLRQLMILPPTFIADTTEEPDMSMTVDPEYRELRQFLQSRYQLLKEFQVRSDRVRIYRLEQ